MEAGSVSGVSGGKGKGKAGKGMGKKGHTMRTAREVRESDEAKGANDDIDPARGAEYYAEGKGCRGGE